MFFSDETYRQYGNPTGKTSQEVEKALLEKAQSRVCNPLFV